MHSPSHIHRLASRYQTRFHEGSKDMQSSLLTSKRVLSDISNGPERNRIKIYHT